jgi:hypothetical protein
LLNHPWLTTEQILNAYKGYFFSLKEGDLRQIIEEVKNINFIDDDNDTGMRLLPNHETGMGKENEGIEAAIL